MPWTANAQHTIVLPGGRRIGHAEPCFIIAEAGVNHNGSIERAFELIDRAAAAGADAVKFQMFKAERLVTRTAPTADYQRKAVGTGETQYDMLKRLELDAHAFEQLAARCKARKILFLATPFDEECADALEALNVEAFKIGSGDLTNPRLLAHIARKHRPMIVSTGMSTLAEVGTAVATIRAAGNPDIVLLHCTTQYPAPTDAINLNAMATMATASNLPVGYSDHTEGTVIPVAATALGACVIEKHFTMDRNLPGPDHRASMEPDELRKMIAMIRTVESALGDGRKLPAACEATVASVARRSIVAARPIPAGTILKDADLALRRPGTGIPPSQLPSLVGRKTRRPIEASELLNLDMLVFASP
jgi:N-acetylneuraminate synthase